MRGHLRPLVAKHLHEPRPEPDSHVPLQAIARNVTSSTVRAIAAIAGRHTASTTSATWFSGDGAAASLCTWLARHPCRAGNSAARALYAARRSAHPAPRPPGAASPDPPHSRGHGPSPRAPCSRPGWPPNRPPPTARPLHAHPRRRGRFRACRRPAPIIGRKAEQGRALALSSAAWPYTEDIVRRVAATPGKYIVIASKYHLASSMPQRPEWVMFETKPVNRSRTLPAVREALDHALAYGDHVTASELTQILAAMTRDELGSLPVATNDAHRSDLRYSRAR